jgi:hypothetical protein
MDMDFLTSPWVIITIIMCFLIGNIAAFKYFTPKNLDKFKLRREDEFDRLIELDKKHQRELKDKESKSSAHEEQQPIIKKDE